MSDKLPTKPKKVSNGTTTRKKLKTIGTKTFIDPETGEARVMNLVEIEERDANFQKIWFAHIMEALDLAGNKKLQVIWWMLKHRDTNNNIIASQREIAQKCGVSYPIVNETIKMMKATHLLRSKKGGNVYTLNPNAIFQGGKNNRMDVLFSYTSLEDESAKYREQYKDKLQKPTEETQIGKNPDTFVQTDADYDFFKS